MLRVQVYISIDLEETVGHKHEKRSGKGVYQSHVACALLWLQSSPRHYVTPAWPFREGP